MSIEDAVGPTYKAHRWQGIQAPRQLGMCCCVDFGGDFPERAVPVAPQGAQMFEDEARSGDGVEHARKAAQYARRLDLKDFRHFHLAGPTRPCMQILDAWHYN